MKNTCKYCHGTGIHTYMIAHAQSYERVYQPCPRCEAGQRIDESRIPEHEWEHHDWWLSWEEQDHYGSPRDEF